MKHSMENFFNWIMKPIPDEEVDIWFNVNNMHFEKIELFGDIFKTLDYLINSTYLGGGKGETVIHLTEENNLSHFDWCWLQTITNFKKESINFNFTNGDVEFFEGFFFEVFYNQTDNKIKETMDEFFRQIFERHGKKTKSDIEIFTDIYKLLERSLKTV